MKFSFYLILFSVFLNSPLVFAKENLNNIHYSEIAKKRPIELYNNNQRKNSFDSCADLFPKENPKETTELTYFKKSKWGIRELCSDNFAVLYADRTKTPLLVIEKLSAKQLKNKNESLQRTDFFFSDPRTPTNGRAKSSDYKNVHPSVDRGHLAPAGNAIRARGMAQTFALSNIFPQDSDNNRGPWRKIEADVRKYISRSEGNIYILSGLIFDKQERNEYILQKLFAEKLFDNLRLNSFSIQRFFNVFGYGQNSKKGFNAIILDRIYNKDDTTNEPLIVNKNSSRTYTIIDEAIVKMVDDFESNIGAKYTSVENIYGEYTINSLDLIKCHLFIANFILKNNFKGKEYNSIMGTLLLKKMDENDYIFSNILELDYVVNDNLEEIQNRSLFSELIFTKVLPEQSKTFLLELLKYH